MWCVRQVAAVVLLKTAVPVVRRSCPPVSMRHIIRHISPFQSSTTVECCTCTPSASPVSGRCRRMTGVVVEEWPPTGRTRHRVETRSPVDSVESVGRRASDWCWERCTLMTCLHARRVAPSGVHVVAVVVRRSSLALARVPRRTPRLVSVTVVDWPSARGASWRITTTSGHSTKASYALNDARDLS